MTRHLPRFAWHAIVVVAVTLGACSANGSPDGAVQRTTASPFSRGDAGRPEAPRPGLSDLTAIDELRAAFNTDTGTPRVLVILSPT